jgi:hypothetical protein
MARVSLTRSRLMRSAFVYQNMLICFQRSNNKLAREQRDRRHFDGRGFSKRRRISRASM